MPADQRIHAHPRDRRAKEHRMHQRLLGLRRKLAAEPAVRDRRLVVYIRGQQRIIVGSQQIDQPSSKISVSGAIWRVLRVAAAKLAGCAHRDQRRVSAARQCSAARVDRARRRGRSC